MTPDQVPVDDLEALHRILANTETLLFDFDGPICAIFAGIPAQYVAQQLRDVLTDGGHTELPPKIQQSADPFDVFRYASTLSENRARQVEVALRTYEVEAVALAKPTPYGDKVIRDARAHAKKVGIVSNNSTAAVQSYQRTHRLDDPIDYVSARSSWNAGLLKPNPHLLQKATQKLEAPASKCAMIGDSLADMEAASAISMPAIGYANRDDKIELLTRGGADVIITSMHYLRRVI